MDLDEIREIIEKDGGKFIIVENGKPVMVIMGFDEYKGKIFIQGESAAGVENNSGNNEIKKPNLSERAPEEGIYPGTSAEPNDEIDIDDLPL